jgi:hypothetical protein
MKRIIPIVLVLLSLCGLPAAAQRTAMSFGACTGVTGFFGADHVLLPIDISVHYGFYPRLIVRAEIGPAYSLGVSEVWLDAAFGVEIPIASGFYGMAEVASWANMSSTNEQIILGLKAGVGCLWKGFFAEFVLPFVWDEGSDFLLGWEIKAGWRYTRAH